MKLLAIALALAATAAAAGTPDAPDRRRPAQGGHHAPRELLRAGRAEGLRRRRRPAALLLLRRGAARLHGGRPARTRSCAMAQWGIAMT